MSLLKTDCQGEVTRELRRRGEGCMEVLLEERRVFKNMHRKFSEGRNTSPFGCAVHKEVE